jgi:putative photosynthetic complex assembly protein
MAENNHQDMSPPRWALIGGGVLIVFSIALAGFGSLTGVGTTEVRPRGVVVSRDLRFLDGPDGGIVVEDAATDQTVAILPSGTNGFVRVVMRGLARHRKVEGLGPDHPFSLTQWSSGHLSIEDRQTGHAIQLGAFGQPNREAFARLLAQKEVRK